MSSPDDSLLLSWVHSESLPSDSDKLSTSTLPLIRDPTLVCYSLTRKERMNDATVACDQITTLTELSYSKLG